MIATGYDSYLAAFEFLIPALIKSFEKNTNTTDTIYNNLQAPINILKSWNYYANENSIAATLAIEWAEKLNPIIQKAYTEVGELDQVTNTKNFADTASHNS